MIISNRDRKVNNSKMSLLLWWPRKDVFFAFSHNSDVIISKMASEINGVLSFYPTVQRHIKENIKAPRHLPLRGEFTGDRWIPRTKGQSRGKCFHLMTSSLSMPFLLLARTIILNQQPPFVKFVNDKIITSWSIGYTEVEKTQSGIIIVDYAN